MTWRMVVATSSKRDNAYYLSRIAAAFPTHYADYLDGKYTSVAELRRATGLISREYPVP